MAKIETLTCEVCGKDWEWKRRGGVKPKSCSVECRKKYLSLYRAKWQAENRESVRARKKSKYAENREEIIAKSRDYYLANRERKLEYQRKYNVENPEVRATSRLRYETRKLGAWKEDVVKGALLERDGWTCHICKGEIPKGLDRHHPLFPHIDHIVPLSKGGEHSYENTAPAHASCNIQKGNMLDGWQDIKPYVPEEVNHEWLCS